MAQLLITTMAAARLMVADRMISGICPLMTQGTVHLCVNLEDVITKLTLADAFPDTLDRINASITIKNA